MFQRPKIDLVHISDILEKFGKYQIIQYIYICYPIFLVAITNLNYIIVAGDVQYRCRIQECDSITSNFTVPWWPNHTDHCTKPTLNQSHLDNDVCSNSSFTKSVEKCTDWIYENHDTIISELKLACQPWKKNLVGTVHSIGMTVAMITAGWMADIIGRKPTLLICTLGCLVGNFKTIASNYYTYILIEFLEAAMSGGVFTVGPILMFEMTGNKNRVLAGVVYAYFSDMGEATIAVIGMSIKHWKTLIYIICSPAIMFLVFIKLGNESPRWLIVKGKASQAKKILKDIAQINNIDIDEKELSDTDEEKLKDLFKISNIVKKQGIIQAFQCKTILLRFAVASFCRFSVSFIYYGLLVNSVVLPGNKYINFLLAAVISFPGELISMYFINKFGRRLPLIIEYVLCGIACVGSAYASKISMETYLTFPWRLSLQFYIILMETRFFVLLLSHWLKIVLFLFGKLIISACYTGITIYTIELFPTSVRGSLTGLCTLSYSFGNMLAPLTPALSTELVSLLFGGAALLACCLLFFVPETKNLPLLDTKEQLTDSIKVKNLSSAPCETHLLEQVQ